MFKINRAVAIMLSALLALSVTPVDTLAAENGHTTVRQAETRCDDRLSETALIKKTSPINKNDTVGLENPAENDYTTDYAATEGTEGATSLFGMDTEDVSAPAAYVESEAAETQAEYGEAAVSESTASEETNGNAGADGIDSEEILDESTAQIPVSEDTVEDESTAQIPVSEETVEDESTAQIPESGNAFIEEQAPENESFDDMDLEGAGADADFEGSDTDTDFEGTGTDADFEGSDADTDFEGAGTDADFEGSDADTDFEGAGTDADFEGSDADTDFEGAGTDTDFEQADADTDFEGADAGYVEGEAPSSDNADNAEYAEPGEAANDESLPEETTETEPVDSSYAGDAAESEGADPAGGTVEGTESEGADAPGGTVEGTESEGTDPAGGIVNETESEGTDPAGGTVDGTESEGADAPDGIVDETEAVETVPAEDAMDAAEVSGTAGTESAAVGLTSGAAGTDGEGKTDPEKKTVDERAILTAMSLSLTDQVLMNVFVQADDTVEDDDYIVFSCAGEVVQQSVADAEKNQMTMADGESVDVLIFDMPLRMRQMTDDVSFHMVVDGEAGTPIIRTVRSYADEILAGSFTDDQKDLTRAMLNCGAYAQEYFEYNLDKPANAGIFEEGADPVKNGTDPDMSAFDYTMEQSDSLLGFQITEATLELKEDISLIIYYKSNWNWTNWFYNISLSNSDKTLENGYDQEKGMYFVKIPHIMPYELNQMFEIEVNSINLFQSNPIVRLSYSPLSFCREMLMDESSSAEIKNLCRSLYYYWDAAYAVRKPSEVVYVK